MVAQKKVNWLQKVSKTHHYTFYYSKYLIRVVQIISIGDIVFCKTTTSFKSRHHTIVCFPTFWGDKIAENQIKLGAVVKKGLNGVLCYFSTTLRTHTHITCSFRYHRELLLLPELLRLHLLFYNCEKSHLFCTLTRFINNQIDFNLLQTKHLNMIVSVFYYTYSSVNH